MDIKAEALKRHYEWRGKIEVSARAPLNSREDLSLAYTPGVAEACLAIRDDPGKSFALTRRWNTVAVVTDGTAVLGLGDIGPEAAMPVMEGKCALFKRFADVDAIPVCLNTKDVDEIVRTVGLIANNYGGINLEDIAAPRCFEVERRLRASLDIPVFHDDQHGTAIVACAAMRNALRVVGKRLDEVRVVINGAGAAGIAIGRLLLKMGVGELIMCDIGGILYSGAPWMNPAQKQISEISNTKRLSGGLKDALKGADALIGVSKPGLVSADMVAGMNKGAVVFAMANPVPEIMPDEAKAGGAAVVGTGRSDFPNQINNVLAFPGVFRGALDVRAADITGGMEAAAANAIAMLAESRLCADYILPDAFDPRLSEAVAAAVAQAAKAEGVARS